MHSCLILRVKFAHICLEGALASVNDRFKRNLRTYDVVLERKIFDVYLPLLLLLSLFLLLLFLYVLVTTLKEEKNYGQRSEGNVFHETPRKLFLCSLLEFRALRLMFEFLCFLKFTCNENINSNV